MMVTSIINITLIMTVVFGIFSIPRVTSHEINCRDPSFTRNSFPSNFIFGVASSAFQGEGANNEDGRGPSIWDTFIEAKKDKIIDISKGRMADSYRRYKEDVAILKDLDVDSYRLSISWSRVIPTGSVKDGVNEKGIAYYNNLLNDLKANGIDVSVTIFHWDLPQALHDKYGGWLSPKIVDDFRDFADLCFQMFGDRVKYWSTINEPLTYAVQGYAVGGMAPGRCSNRTLCALGNSGTEPYLVVHNMLLAHSAAVNVYKRKYQVMHNSKIGIVLNTGMIEPLTDSPADIEAADRQLDFNLGWHLQPLISGEYPQSMQKLVKERLPKFTDEESKLLKNTFDFIGLNYYAAAYGSDASNDPPPKLADYNTDSRVNTTAERNGKLIGEQAASDWLHVYPQGLYDLLMHVKKKYSNPLVIITENGVDEKNDEKLSIQEARKDPKRIQYLQDHLRVVHKAIDDGCNVQGYYEWSLFDNFEWGDAETVRFGIYYVDFVNDSQRFPKDSAIWYKKFLQRSCNAPTPSTK